MKLFAAALVLAMTGTVYAAGLTQDATHTHATATEKPGCCKMHQAGDKKSAASAQDTCDMKDGGCCKADCCKTHVEKSQANAHAKSQARNASAEGCECCSGGGCCQAHKEHVTATKIVIGSGSGTDAGGCATADCCKDCACCKAHHATAPEATADQGDHQGCGASCRMAHGAGR